MTIIDMATLRKIKEARASEPLAKARYIRRIPTGKPSRPWRYVYTMHKPAPARSEADEEQKQIAGAQAARAAHGASLDAFKGKLSELAGPNALAVKARVKDVRSIRDKLKRKPKYKSAHELQDVTGARIVHRTNAEVLKTVTRIEAEYHVVESADYIRKPKATGYMSYHLIVRDHDGLEKEIQVRTAAQDVMGDWGHQFYKPKTRAQRAVMAKMAPVANAHVKALWQWHEKRDNGADPGPKPPTPHPEITRAFGADP